MMGNMGSGWMDGFGMGYGYGIPMILFWGAIILLAVALFRMLTKKTDPEGSTTETPLSVLEKRFAKGELTPETFEEMRQTLNGT